MKKEVTPPIVRRMVDHPTVKKLRSHVQIDAPFVLSYCFACLLVQAILSDDAEGIKHTWFAVGPTFELSISGVFRIFGQTIGHGSWAHLHGNLMLLLLAGPPCEAAFGSARLFKVAAAAAAASSFAHMLQAPLLGTEGNSILLGASSVVFALILLNSLLQRRNGKITLTFILTASLWLYDEVFCSKPDDGISHTAHLAGAGVGSWVGFNSMLVKTWWGATRRKHL